MEYERSGIGGETLNPKMKNAIHTVIRYGLYGVFLFVILFPIYWIFTMSIKNYKDVIAFPPKFAFELTWENYQQLLFNGQSIGSITQIPDFIQYIINSSIISFSAVLLGMILGVPAAYVLGRETAKWSDGLAATFMSYRFAPELVVILPLFMFYKNLGFYDTYLGLILVHQLITLPLIIWIMRGYFREVPGEVEEAARIDGASEWTVFLKVMLPMVKSGLGSAMIIAFVFSWNNLLFGLIMSGGNTMPVTMGILQTMTFDQIKWGEMAAAAIVSSVPGIILAVFAQRFLVKGLTMGAIK